MLKNLLANWLKDLPGAVQYVVVIGLVLVILYICLTVTRLFGKNRGEKVSYDNPEEYEKQVPDLFASTAFKRKKIKTDSEEKKD